jgi:hypothetical protein
VKQIGNIINNHSALGEKMKKPCEMHQEHQIPKKFPSAITSSPPLPQMENILTTPLWEYVTTPQ